MNHYARSLEAALQRATTSPADFIRSQRDGEPSHEHFSGLPRGALAYLIARLWQQRPASHLLVTATPEAAQDLATSLRFFLGPESAEHVAHYPATDTSPYMPIAADRRIQMDQMRVLARLAAGSASDIVVTSISALSQRVPSASIIRSHTQMLRVGESFDRDAVSLTLSAGGYLNAPLAEDPGTFALRGSILDIFPTSSPWPVRVEFDDTLISALRRYDPDTQRTLDPINAIMVAPAKLCLLEPGQDTEIRRRLRAVCDKVDFPSTRAAALIDDLMSGRIVPGAEGYLPCYGASLSSPLDLLPRGTRVTLVDPSRTGRVGAHFERGLREEYSDRIAQGTPSCEPESLFIPLPELAARLGEHPLYFSHQLTYYGEMKPEEDGGGPVSTDWERLYEPPTDGVHNFGGSDHFPLRQAIKNRRSQTDAGGSLAPLGDAIQGWLGDGLRVCITARTRTQGDRLRTLIGHIGHRARRPVDFEPALLSSPISDRPEILVGDLGSGFALPTAGVVLVTEEEIFGQRRRRQRAKPKANRRRAEAFLEDLRQLTEGDYIVHLEHGIGRYLGLERKSLGQSKMDRMKGIAAASVEVLVVEYAGGDKLFLPVTRLNQIQKFSNKETSTPKLDKLGGQTFARKKTKAQKKAQDIADQLLRLYAERSNVRRPPLAPPGSDYAEFEATFPFEETRDQQRAIDDVLSDLESASPMDRLVCGDVGFGKTEVALRAAFRVALAGRQVAVLCPTTVLAQQHFRTFTARLRDYPLRVRTLSRFVDRAQQKETLAELQSGEVDIIVGTHRLLSKDVHFHDLGLLIVDEEQRFGVTHKERIKDLKREVDVLTLTATPIPRTLQMAVGGLRELSLIATPPVDRRAVRTFLCRWDEQLLAEAIRRELRRGGQVFFVYNRIEGLYERGQRLQELVPEARIAVAHGQLKESLLETIMVDFVEGQHDVLCSTAIVESGLDIPRANTIIIDRADMFGLAQLYQLRGRVGRSKERAYCYLITPPEHRITDEARFRMQAMERFTELGSGFQVASLDMELRGAGDLLGADQSGTVSAVGLDIFVTMLRDAVAALEGHTVQHEVDPELTIDADLHLPEEYIADTGLRLSLYKRLATAPDDESIQEIASEIEERFGPAPPAVRRFVRAMRLRPRLRRLHVLGCEAGRRRVRLHLRRDTPLNPSDVMQLVATPQSPWKLTPEMQLSRTFPDDDATAVQRVEAVLDALEALNQKPHTT